MIGAGVVVRPPPGDSGSVYPWGLWVWTGLTGLATAVLILGWRGSARWRRAVSVLAVPLCVLSAATVLNSSLGYLPTVTTAWQRATGTLPPQWIDTVKLDEMRRDGVRPTAAPSCGSRRTTSPDFPTAKSWSTCLRCGSARTRHRGCRR